MAKHNILGKRGEDLAAEYLEQHGYTIHDRDWHCGHKDLDLVVTKDDTIVFVEVKTRTSTEWGDPQDFVDDRKIRRIVNSADAYLRYYQIDMDVRFDIISIVMDQGELKVEHIEQAFFPPVE
ncbi:MAG: YraN family protein [Bacteroidaceae bacterium]|jgi:putative endonuclease|nr:YraN family protein [Bacteroidaceae bacterium]MBR4594228.1 YraN family protein [Bacteroidaceae bacterium]